MAKQIYLVEGASGHWEDYRTWAVRAFRKKPAAVTFAAKATAAAQKAIEHHQRRVEKYLNDDAATEYPKDPTTPLDPKMRYDSMGVSYTVIPVILVEE